MAVTTEYLEVKLQIRSSHGVVDGKEKIATRTYGDVKRTATDQDIYDTAVIIDGLQQPVMVECLKQETILLISA